MSNRILKTSEGKIKALIKRYPYNYYNFINFPFLNKNAFDTKYQSYCKT